MWSAVTILPQILSPLGRNPASIIYTFTNPLPCWYEFLKWKWCYKLKYAYFLFIPGGFSKKSGQICDSGIDCVYSVWYRTFEPSIQNYISINMSLTECDLPNQHTTTKHNCIYFSRISDEKSLSQYNGYTANWKVFGKCEVCVCLKIYLMCL